VVQKQTLHSNTLLEMLPLALGEQAVRTGVLRFRALLVQE